MWGLTKSVNKGGLLLILRTETTDRGQVWTCKGAFDLAINMRPNYPHYFIRLCRDCDLVVNMLLWCIMPILGTTRYHDGGMERQSRPRSISIPSLRGARLDRYPSFSPFLLSIYLLFPCLMLTLGIISNNVNVKQNHEDLNHRTGLCR